MDKLVCQTVGVALNCLWVLTSPVKVYRTCQISPTHQSFDPCRPASTIVAVVTYMWVSHVCRHLSHLFSPLSLSTASPPSVACQLGELERTTMAITGCTPRRPRCILATSVHLPLLPPIRTTCRWSIQTLAALLGFSPPNPSSVAM
jgi:hypothetical protein